MCGVMPFGGWVLNQMNYKLNIKIVNSSKIGGGKVAWEEVSYRDALASKNRHADLENRIS